MSLGILSNLENAINGIDDKSSIEIGWFDGDMPMIANVQEYGAMIPVTSKSRAFFGGRYGIHLTTNSLVIPPRPHRQRTINEKAETQWANDLSKALKNANYSLITAFNEVGEKWENDYREVLTDGQYQELSPMTLDIRKQDGIGGDTPLVATGKMQASLTYKVGD
jgi:hypothetical protein